MVTGALQRSPQSGLLCFERTVETTFVLPWDLNPKVHPQKLSTTVRDGIRTQLLDGVALAHLESCSALNWNQTLLWQCKGVEGSWLDAEVGVAKQLEEGYSGPSTELVFCVVLTRFKVDFLAGKLLNLETGAVFDIRRLSFAPLMPMKTEQDGQSLFHAASLGFWGVHDRTQLLCQATSHSLADMKAQFMLYERWSAEVTRNTTSGAKPEFPQWEAAKNSLTTAPQLHLFTLANIVQRPIIVYSHPDCPVGGVYLPLLWETTTGEFPCVSHPHLRTPLALGYDASRCHFTPAITFKGARGPDPILLPLTHANGQMLTLHFLSTNQVSMEPTALLSKMLYVDIIPPPTSGLATPTPHPPSLAAVCSIAEMPEVMDSLVKRYESLFL